MGGEQSCTDFAWLFIKKIYSLLRSRHVFKTLFLISNFVNGYKDIHPHLPLDLYLYTDSHFVLFCFIYFIYLFIFQFLFFLFNMLQHITVTSFPQADIIFGTWTNSCMIRDFILVFFLFISCNLLFTASLFLLLNSIASFHCSLLCARISLNDSLMRFLALNEAWWDSCLKSNVAKAWKQMWWIINFRSN